MGNESCMRSAIDEATVALGQVAPLPAVGAVVVRDQQIVGRGHTDRELCSHAEPLALSRAGKAAKGAELFVTLEPCAHQGSTPPCTKAIIDAGISAVHIAMLDPNPISLSGVQELQDAGIDVHVGVENQTARQFMQGYLKWLQTKRPLVSAKWAMSQDGRLVTPHGQPRYISGSEALMEVHRMRAYSDAILVGINTVLKDDPSLTCRLDGYSGEHPLRVILDRSARTPIESRMLSAETPGSTLIVVSPDASQDKVKRLTKTGVEVITLPFEPAEQINALLGELGDRGVHNLLVEGGTKVLQSFFTHSVVDRLDCFVSSKRFGTTVDTGSSFGDDIGVLRRVLKSADITVKSHGEDVQVSAVLHEYHENQDPNGR
tara:strand:+ start:3893 stop:5014 length:1122 start_codon:yes stop_codon:yes gene_type:complete